SAFRAKSVSAELIAEVPLVFSWDFITKGATIPMAIASSKMRAVTARTVIRRVRTNAKAASNATPAAMSVVTHHDQPRSTMTARLLATARKDSAPADQAGNVFWAFAYNIAALPLVARHVLAVVAAATGAVLARRAVRANERGYQEALRLLLVARRSAVDVRREALGQLRGVIVTAPDRLREELRVLPSGRLLERC